MIRRQGFTLAEVMVTMVIISLVMAATMPIVLKSQNSPSEAPFKYVTQGKLVQNAAVYSALGATATVLLGDKRVPIDHNITTNIDYIYATKMNPKLSIVTRSATSNPVVSRHLIDFYEKDDSSNYISIGKVSFDKYFNLSLGLNSLASIDSDQKYSLINGSSTTGDWADLTMNGNTVDPVANKGVANTAVGQYSMGGDAKYYAYDGATETPSRNFSGNGNTAVGAFSMRMLTTGSLNTGIGAYALHSTYTTAAGTDGEGNPITLNLTGSGSHNTAVGAYAMKNNVAGGFNTALGSFALTTNATGSTNVGIGHRSLSANTSGSSNISIGYASMIKNTTGQRNTVVGTNSLINNTTGDNNIVIGFESLHSNTEGSNNIVIGNSINFGDGSGEESNKLYIGSYKDSTDTACGFIFGDMTKTSNSSPNTPSITLKAKKITIGNGVAPDAGIADDTGAELTVNTVVNTIGNGDDDSLLTVNTVKTTIGKDGNAQTFINGSAYIGTEVAANNANKIVTVSDVQNIIDKAYAQTGDSPTYAVHRGDISSVSILSDARLKNITGDNTAGLKEIMQLQVKNYTMKRDKNKEPMVGVIAQDLQKIFPNSVTEGRDGYLRIKRDEIFYACVNAIKELANKIQDILAKITGLEEKIRILEDRNKVNEEKINALERQNKLFEERLNALENKFAETKAVKKTVKKQEETEIKVAEPQEEKK